MHIHITLSSTMEYQVYIVIRATLQNGIINKYAIYSNLSIKVNGIIKYMLTTKTMLQMEYYSKEFGYHLEKE